MEFIINFTIALSEYTYSYISKQGRPDTELSDFKYVGKAFFVVFLFADSLLELKTRLTQQAITFITNPQ